MERYFLAYDSACGPCTRFKHLVDLLDRHSHLDFVSLYEAEELSLLSTVPKKQRYRSFHLVSPNGKVLSGSAAIPELLGLLPAGKATSVLLYSVPGGKRLVTFVYGTLSRLHDSASCSSSIK
jgi:predicted DCC family thiol-disulfide oxidoreductase YuxK